MGAKAMMPGQSLAEATGGSGEAVAKAGSPLLGTLRNLLVLSAILKIVDLVSDKPKPGDDVNQTLGGQGQVVAKKDSSLLNAVVGLVGTMAMLQVLDDAMSPGPAKPTAPKSSAPKI